MPIVRRGAGQRMRRTSDFAFLNKIKARPSTEAGLGDSSMNRCTDVKVSGHALDRGMAEWVGGWKDGH